MFMDGCLVCAQIGGYCGGGHITAEARVRVARGALEAARNEWAQAHLSDTESEDARQRVLDAEEALAAAEAALAAE